MAPTAGDPAGPGSGGSRAAAPTGASRPYYLRLEQRLTPADGRAFWDRFAGLLDDAPYLLEIKGAERATED